MLLAQISQPQDGSLLTWALQAIKWAICQYQQGNYVPIIAACVMAAVTLVQKFELTRIKNKKLVPYFSAGLGVLLSCAANITALSAGSKPHDWVTAIMTGLTVGTAASGFWEIVGQHVLRKFISKKTVDELIGENIDSPQ